MPKGILIILSNLQIKLAYTHDTESLSYKLKILLIAINLFINLLNEEQAKNNSIKQIIIGNDKIKISIINGLKTLSVSFKE